MLSILMLFVLCGCVSKSERARQAREDAYYDSPQANADSVATVMRLREQLKGMTNQ